MFRKLTAIITVFITSFVLFVNPVRAESLPVNFIDYNQVSSIYDTTKEIVDTLGDVMETVGDIVEIVTIGGTAICIASSIVSTTVLPPAAALLPYCSAIGIVDSGHAVTKVIKKPKKALRILKYAF